MEKINTSCFNKNNVFVINLDRRKDRLKSCSDRLKSLNIPFTRFSAIEPDMKIIKDDQLWKNSYQGISHDKSLKFKNYLKGSIGCKMSQYSVIKIAKDNDLPYVVVFEDDIILLDNADDILKEVYSFINNKNDWDILYLGGKITGKIHETVNGYKYINRVQSVLQALSYVVNNKKYDFIMENFVKRNIECDNILESLGRRNKIKIYHCHIFKQTWNDSDIISGYIKNYKNLK